MWLLSFSQNIQMSSKIPASWSLWVHNAASISLSINQHTTHFGYQASVIRIQFNIIKSNASDYFYLLLPRGLERLQILEISTEGLWCWWNVLPSCFQSKRESSREGTKEASIRQFYNSNKQELFLQTLLILICLILKMMESSICKGRQEICPVSFGGKLESCTWVQPSSSNIYWGQPSPKWVHRQWTQSIW